MPILTIITIIIFVGLAVFSRGKPNKTSSPATSPLVMGEVDEASASATPNPISTTSPKPSSTPINSNSSNDSKISIHVDANTSGNHETIIYPGANNTGGNTYQTTDSADAVYNWYVGELNKRSYNIRNNVKTRANDKFKAVLQGVSSSNSFKVTIDQENAGAKTIITIE